VQSEALTFHVASEWRQVVQESEYLISALELSRDESICAAHRHLDVLVLMGMASAIEKCYSGMERLFKVLAENLDDYVPKGDTWHKSLIDQMSSKVGQRDPVISADTAQGLHDLRAFRHRERNSYSLDLDKKRVMELGEQVFVVMVSLKNDLSSNLQITEIEAIPQWVSIDDAQTTPGVVSCVPNNRVRYAGRPEVAEPNIQQQPGDLKPE
jgi:hypothetical protein